MESPKHEHEFSDNLLDTEAGMFLMEIVQNVENAEELIGASEVSDEIKEKCRKIVGELVTKAKTETRVDIYDHCRSALVKLLDVLDQEQEEQKQLYEALRSVILGARDSAKGWKSNS
jgi:hypothetical protein